MSRRARAWQAAREAKHAAFFGGPEDDGTDDEGGIDVQPDAPCYVCGARQSVTDSGCCGIDGERAECPRW